LRTDRIDVFHLHSCPRETLERDDILRALDDAKRGGKIHVAAYSGENEALEHAIACGAFGSVQCSVNVCDQRALSGAIVRANDRGLGVVGKRAVANFAFARAERPTGTYAEAYWDRLHAMRLDLGGDPLDTALRFSAFAPGVHTVLVGTAGLEHLRRCLECVDRGPLAAERVEAIRSAFAACDHNWVGQI
jgi:aryl-alcohol dehydrogenase-like predicted oxidoreductase